MTGISYNKFIDIVSRYTHRHENEVDLTMGGKKQSLCVHFQ